MKTLALVTQKGGSGKSTLAANLAVAASQAREKVFLLELDKQGTLRRWVDRRETELPAFDRIETAAGLAPALAQIAANGFTLTVLDTAGADSPLATAAIQAADLCLIPTRPTPADLEATQATLEAIQGARRRFAFVLNQAPVRSSRLTEAAAGLRVLGLLAEPPIAQRNDFQDALGLGLGVTEHNPEGKAAAEVQALWAWVAKRMKG
mgnify:CR=1 FL=1|jgi:chromosome partitioning protein